MWTLLSRARLVLCSRFSINPRIASASLLFYLIGSHSDCYYRAGAVCLLMFPVVCMAFATQSACLYRAQDRCILTSSPIGILTTASRMTQAFVSGLFKVFISQSTFLEHLLVLYRLVTVVCHTRSFLPDTIMG